MSLLSVFFNLFRPTPVKADEIREILPPNVPTKTRDFKNAVALIKRHEGFRANAYLCPAGKPTIGYGITKNVKLSDTVTREQAERDLLEDILNERLPAIERLVTVPLSNNEVNALISFVYNIGVGNFQTSTLLRLLNDNYPRSVVAEQFSRWNRGGGQVLKGLVRRRDEEKRLFSTPDLVPFRLS